MSRCELYLENSADHYTGGETILGHVSVTFHSDKEVLGISLIIKGEAKTYWPKMSIASEVRSYGSYVIISNEIELLGQFTASFQSGLRKIAAGVYKYPFRYTLPKNLQSTFEGSKGSIEYKIKAVVKRPILANYKAESRIVIVTPVNLNKNPSLCNPVSRTITKPIHFSCRGKGAITVEVKIPQTGIAIGEELPLHISVLNRSRSNIDQIRCKVKKNINYTATFLLTKTRSDSATIFSDSYTGVSAQGENTYDQVVLINSSSSIPNFINCSIIEVNYELEITFVICGMHKNIEIKIPITVGHIALGVMAMEQVTSAVPPSYGFVNPQPAYNPDVLSGIAYKKTGGFREYPPALPSAPSASGTDVTPVTVPSLRDHRVSAIHEDQANKNVPTYYQATHHHKKKKCHHRPMKS